MFIPLLGAGLAVLVGLSYISSAHGSRKQAGRVLLGVGIVLGILWLLALSEMSTLSGFNEPLF